MTPISNSADQAAREQVGAVFCKRDRDVQDWPTWAIIDDLVVLLLTREREARRECEGELEHLLVGVHSLDRLGIENLTRALRRENDSHPAGDTLKRCPHNPESHVPSFGQCEDCAAGDAGQEGEG